MKRHPALESLSRDHHQALVVAQRLRRADDAQGASAAFLAFWPHASAHFRVEEEVLLPAIAAHVHPDHPLVVSVLVDHVRIRHWAARLETGPSLELAELQGLGARLGEHVRLEERELFVLVEQTLPADELDALGRTLDQGEMPRAG